MVVVMGMGIEDEGDGGDGQGNEVAQDQSQCRGAADSHVAGEHEEEDRRGHDAGAHGDEQKFFDVAFCKHGDFLAFCKNPLDFTISAATCQ